MRIKRAVEDRAGVLGSSSVAKAIAVSTFGTPYDAYLDYIGKKREFTEEEQARLDMGHDLEDFIAHQAEKRWGMKVRTTNYAYINPTHPKLMCHPDRLVSGAVMGERVALEIKSNTAFDRRWGQEDTDQIPMDYLVQCLTYFICQVPCDVVWLVRFSNNRLSRYIIRPDAKVQAEIVTLAEDWMARVDAGWVPDPLTYEEATSIYSAPTSGEIAATDSIAEKISRLSELRDEIRVLNAEADAIKTEIVGFMQGKEVLSYNGNAIATYRKIFQNRFDSMRFESEHPELYHEYLKESSYMRLS